MPKSSLNIIYWNARGIRNKIPELQSLANDVHILCLQETLITKANQVNISVSSKLIWFLIPQKFVDLAFLYATISTLPL